MPPSPVVITLRGMEREAGDVAVRPADPLPARHRQDLAADGAGRVLDQRQAMALRPIAQHARQIAGHADLVDAEDGPGRGGDRRLDQAGIDVVAARLDVDEDRLAPQ